MKPKVHVAKPRGSKKILSSHGDMSKKMDLYPGASTSKAPPIYRGRDIVVPMEYCAKLLTVLWRRMRPIVYSPLFKLFEENTEDSSNYDKVVQKPMDLITVGDKLSTGRYQNETEFLKDVRLAFSNCCRFFHGRHHNIEFAQQLEYDFEQYYSRMPSGIQINNPVFDESYNKLFIFPMSENYTIDVLKSNAEDSSTCESSSEEETCLLTLNEKKNDLKSEIFSREQKHKRKRDAKERRKAKIDVTMTAMSTQEINEFHVKFRRLSADDVHRLVSAAGIQNLYVKYSYSDPVANISKLEPVDQYILYGYVNLCLKNRTRAIASSQPSSANDLNQPPQTNIAATTHQKDKVSKPKPKKRKLSNATKVVMKIRKLDKSVKSPTTKTHGRRLTFSDSEKELSSNKSKKNLVEAVNNLDSVLSEDLQLSETDSEEDIRSTKVSGTKRVEKSPTQEPPSVHRPSFADEVNASSKEPLKDPKGIPPEMPDATKIDGVSEPEELELSSNKSKKNLVEAINNSVLVADLQLSETDSEEDVPSAKVSGATIFPKSKPTQEPPSVHRPSFADEENVSSKEPLKDPKEVSPEMPEALPAAKIDEGSELGELRKIPVSIPLFLVDNQTNEVRDPRLKSHDGAKPSIGKQSMELPVPEFAQSVPWARLSLKPSHRTLPTRDENDLNIVHEPEAPFQFKKSAPFTSLDRPPFKPLNNLWTDAGNLNPIHEQEAPFPFKKPGQPNCVIYTATNKKLPTRASGPKPNQPNRDQSNIHDESRDKGGADGKQSSNNDTANCNGIKINSALSQKNLPINEFLSPPFTPLAGKLATTETLHIPPPSSGSPALLQEKELQKKMETEKRRSQDTKLFEVFMQADMALVFEEQYDIVHLKDQEWNHSMHSSYPARPFRMRKAPLQGK